MGNTQTVPVPTHFRFTCVDDVDGDGPCTTLMRLKYRDARGNEQVLDSNNGYAVISIPNDSTDIKVSFFRIGGGEEWTIPVVVHKPRGRDGVLYSLHGVQWRRRDIEINHREERSLDVIFEVRGKAGDSYVGTALNFGTGPTTYMQRGWEWMEFPESRDRPEKLRSKAKELYDIEVPKGRSRGFYEYEPLRYIHLNHHHHHHHHHGMQEMVNEFVHNHFR